MKMIWTKGDKPGESGRYSIIYRIAQGKNLYLLSGVEYSAKNDAWNASDDDASNAFESIEVVAYMQGDIDQLIINEVMNNDRS